MKSNDHSDYTVFNKVFSAIFYATSSVLIVFANKIVLTSYSFPSFQILAIGQLAFSLVGLFIANQFNLIRLPKFDLHTIDRIMPLPLFYFGNILFGLGGTKALNLPMFVVLRRFSVLMTMYAEMFILKTKKPLSIQLCVYGMIAGALIAASADLSFELYGYVYMMLNNVFSTANAICIKDKLTASSLDEYGLLYYNAFFALVPMAGLSVYSGEMNKLEGFEHWASLGFWFFFILSSVMGFLLNFSVMLCTKYNSPLSTTVFGCLKNIFVTYGGIFIGGDYVFSMTNFVGLTISALSSVVYSFVTFKMPTKKSQNEQPLKQISIINGSLVNLNASELKVEK